MGHSKSAVEWAFSLAIFFLGMSAAFLGNVVEKNIHRSSLIAAICFAVGMIGSGLCMMWGHAAPCAVMPLVGSLVCYGFIMGVGLGTGYLSPVKTLMLWFSESKGLATGLAGSVAVLGIVSAMFNAGGRFFLSAATNKLKDRNTMYKLIFAVSLALTLLVALVLALVFLVNEGYGGGFFNVPTPLSDRYGMSNISAIHGITLSAWAFAGLTGNQMAGWIVSRFGTPVEIAGNLVNPTGYQTVLCVTLVMYAVALLCSLFLVRSKEREP